MDNPKNHMDDLGWYPHFRTHPRICICNYIYIYYTHIFTYNVCLYQELVNDRLVGACWFALVFRLARILGTLRVRTRLDFADPRSFSSGTGSVAWEKCASNTRLLYQPHGVRARWLTVYLLWEARQSTWQNPQPVSHQALFATLHVIIPRISGYFPNIPYHETSISPWNIVAPIVEMTLFVSFYVQTPFYQL